MHCHSIPCRSIACASARILCLALFLFADAGTSHAASPEHAGATPPSIERMAGAMIMTGFRGLSAPPSILEALHSGRLGGVILFDRDHVLKGPRNIAGKAQLQKLTATLLKASPNAFIAIDQEGGKVRRLKPSSGFLDLPSAAETARLPESELSDLARRAGREMSSLGINVDFAPCADVQRTKHSPGLGDKGRLYGSDPALVAKKSASFSRGLASAGVIPALKHFPGLGSGTVDSHLSLPDVTARWNESELIPYRNAFRSGWKGMVLVAHVYNRNLDPEAPASLSRRVIGGLLRQKLGWKGVVISDDLQMGAVAPGCATLDDLVLRAVEAGCDILLFGNNLSHDPDLHEKVFQALMRHVKSGRISPARIRESWLRITALKKAFGINLQ